VSATDVLKPGDVLAVRLPGWFSEAIRVGEELSGKPGLENHIALFHHYDDPGVPWGLEGRPGGVGWVDLRAYLRSPYTLNNCLQPGRTDQARAVVAKQAEALLGDKYSWAAIGGDTLAALHIHLWNLKLRDGLAPGPVVCSSYAAWLYEQAGWERPPATDRDTEPADWVSMVIGHQWSATIGVMQ
jgi:hypothetical protein